MAGNKNSGRKQLKKKSVEYRFMMPGNIDQALKEKSSELGVSPKQLLKNIASKHLKIDNC